MTWNAAATTLLQARAGFHVRWLVYVVAKDRSTGDPVPYGMWTDVETVDLVIDGDPRTYQGMAGNLVPPAVKLVTGTLIQKASLTVHGLTPEASALFETYDVRLAPIEIHQALFSEDMTLVDTRRRVKGFINSRPKVIPAENGVHQTTLEIASTARRGTMTIGANKSDEAQQRRYSGDRFRRYGSLGEVTSDIWGNND